MWRKSCILLVKKYDKDLKGLGGVRMREISVGLFLISVPTEKEAVQT